MAQSVAQWRELRKPPGEEKLSCDTAFGDGEGRNRTGDTTIFSRVLYQLSYLAKPAHGSEAGPLV